MRTKISLALLSLLCLTVIAKAQFEDYFHDRTLRFDYFHAGNADMEYYYFDELLDEPFWGGSKVNLIDTLRYGQYFFEVTDLLSDQIIYSRGYCTLFGEWQTTDEAKQTYKSFTETVVLPFPKNNVRVDFYSRNRKGIFEKKFEYIVDVNDYFIKKERRMEYPVYDVHLSGLPEHKVDLVLLPEGYSSSEMELFMNDCKTFADHLFSFEPYTSNKDKFNIRAVLAASPESGCDIPAEDIWVKTLLDVGFYTFNSERYCMTTNNKAVRDMAANTPYDQIYILANHKKYGGGAIYNYYSLSVNSNRAAAKIFIHEFGHGFAGLGDDYYYCDVVYSDFYPLDVEPWESNLTTLVDFDKKWKNLLDPETPIPTPINNEFSNVLGVFEGGGYAAKGIYRPAVDCLMHTFKGNTFCQACSNAIKQMIDFYSE